MLKVGGYIMHMTPSNNFLDHGFYSISPTLYYDYYKKNKFKILKSSIYINNGKGDISDNQQPHKNFLLDYTPGCIAHKSMGGWSSESVMSWFCVQKTTESTFNLTPTQSNQSEAWSTSTNEKKTILRKPKNKFLINLYDRIKNVKLIYIIFLKFLALKKKMRLRKKLNLTKIKL